MHQGNQYNGIAGAGLAAYWALGRNTPDCPIITIELRGYGGGIVELGSLVQCHMSRK